MPCKAIYKSKTFLQYHPEIEFLIEIFHLYHTDFLNKNEGDHLILMPSKYLHSNLLYPGLNFCLLSPELTKVNLTKLLLKCHSISHSRNGINGLFHLLPLLFFLLRLSLSSLWMSYGIFVLQIN